MIWPPICHLFSGKIDSSDLHGRLANYNVVVMYETLYTLDTLKSIDFSSSTIIWLENIVFPLEVSWNKSTCSLKFSLKFQIDYWYRDFISFLRFGHRLNIFVCLKSNSKGSSCGIIVSIMRMHSSWKPVMTLESLVPRINETFAMNWTGIWYKQ